MSNNWKNKLKGDPLPWLLENQPWTKFRTVIISFLLLLFLCYLFRSNKILMVIFIVTYSISIRAFVVQAYKIPAGSMLPTVLIGDRILSNKYIYKFSEPTRGDIVIFPFPENPNVDYIKRIIAMEGDTIEIKNKNVYLNGKKLEEKYAIHQTSQIIPENHSPRDYFPQRKVPANCVFVMGDNRDNSYDSRFWGFVNVHSIKAKVENIYWSWDGESDEIRWSRIGKMVR